MHGLPKHCQTPGDWKHMYPSSCGITSCLVSSFFLGDVTSGIATTFWLEKVYDQCLKWFTCNSYTPAAKRPSNTIVTSKTLHTFLYENCNYFYYKRKIY